MIRIRLADLEDVPQLRLIEHETAAMFPRSVLPAHMAEPVPSGEVAMGIARSTLWVAESVIDGAVGFVLCCRTRDCLHVREMDVRPSYGRRGIGLRLLRHTFRVARHLGVPYITLTTFSHLPWNAPFYGRHGFVAADDLQRFPHLGVALQDERRNGLDNRIAMVRSVRRRAPLQPMTNSIRGTVAATAGERQEELVRNCSNSVRR